MKSIINHTFKRTSFDRRAATLVNLPARASLAKLLRPELALAVVFGLSISICELATASAATWTNTGSLLVPQDYPTDVLLANGKVLAIDPAGPSAEIYDPATGVWTATAGSHVARFSPSTTLLADGRVVVAGGWNSQSEYLSSAEIYNPHTGQWTSTGQ
jgi:hypothetical protein